VLTHKIGNCTYTRLPRQPCILKKAFFRTYGTQKPTWKRRNFYSASEEKNCAGDKNLVQVQDREIRNMTHWEMQLPFEKTQKWEREKRVAVNMAYHSCSSVNVLS
jgi:hypothetical protein